MPPLPIISALEYGTFLGGVASIVSPAVINPFAMAGFSAHVAIPVPVFLAVSNNRAPTPLNGAVGPTMGAGIFTAKSVVACVLCASPAMPVSSFGAGTNVFVAGLGANIFGVRTGVNVFGKGTPLPPIALDSNVSPRLEETPVIPRPGVVNF